MHQMSTLSGAGSRLAERNQGGYAADLTSYMSSGVLSGIWEESAFSSGEVDGKLLLAPHKADVTNVIWYNVDMFDELGITPQPLGVN